MDGVKLSELAGAGGPAAIVTVVDTKGSAPRHPGAAMLVAPGKALAGTVGGGKGESAAIELAKKAIAERRSYFLEFEMLGDDAEGQELICGGVNRMLVEYVEYVEYVDSGAYRVASAEIDAGKRVALLKAFKADGAAEAPGVTPVSLLVSVLGEDGQALDVSPKPEAAHAVAAAKACSTGKPAFFEAEGSWAFVDSLIPEEKLFVIGAGHVGRALVEASKALGFSITVIDDRAELSAAGRFGPGVAMITGDYVPAIEAFPFDSSTYAVIVTRGHLFDLECARAVLKRPHRYAGLIGSARKVKMIREKLAEDGIPAGVIERLHSPIGVAIAAETPEEIAVSILAEMIAVRRGASK